MALFITGGAVEGPWGGHLAVAAFVGTPLAAMIYLWRYPSGVKNPDEKLATIERSSEKEEPPSRWERRQRLTPDWRSRAPARRSEVLRLVKEHRGALVRALPDGTTELLTGRKGATVRYLVTEDGLSSIVESISDGTHETLGKIILGAFAVFVGSWVLAASIDAPALMWLAFGAFIVAGFAFMARGSAETESGALLQTQRGERWTSLGYPED